MYDDNNWNEVTGEERAGFLEQELLNPIDSKFKPTANTQVVWRQLPFYERVVLIRVTDPAWTPKKLKIYFLTLDGVLYRLNGYSGPIHEVNAAAPVQINEANVLEYLRFFCFFVRGEEGPFLIAEDMKNPDMPQDMDAQTRAVVEGTIRPASYEGRSENGHMLCDGVVFYSNALFIANFEVQPTGMITMIDDEPIAADLPVRVDCPIA